MVTGSPWEGVVLGRLLRRHERLAGGLPRQGTDEVGDELLRDRA